MRRADLAATHTVSISYVYDPDGNRIRKETLAELNEYQWDPRNQLVKFEPTGTPADLTYNADGQRVVKQVDAEVTRYLYDFEKLLAEYDADNDENRFYTATTEEYGDLVSQWDESEGSVYHQFDGQWSTDALIDDSQAVAARYAHRAFGLQTLHAGAADTPYTFVGKQGYYRDDTLDLYLLGAGNGGRYYDAAQGRFISTDSLRYEDDPSNLYRYVKNDPLNLIDPSGEACASCNTAPRGGNATVAPNAPTAPGMGSMLPSLAVGGMSGLIAGGAQVAGLIQNPFKPNLPNPGGAVAGFGAGLGAFGGAALQGLRGALGVLTGPPMDTKQVGACAAWAAARGVTLPRSLCNLDFKKLFANLLLRPHCVPKQVFKAFNDALANPCAQLALDTAQAGYMKTLLGQAEQMFRLLEEFTPEIIKWWEGWALQLLEDVFTSVIRILIPYLINKVREVAKAIFWLTGNLGNPWDIALDCVLAALAQEMAKIPSPRELAQIIMGEVRKFLFPWTNPLWKESIDKLTECLCAAFDALLDFDNDKLTASLLCMWEHLNALLAMITAYICGLVLLATFAVGAATGSIFGSAAGLPGTAAGGAAGAAAGLATAGTECFFISIGLFISELLRLFADILNELRLMMILIRDGKHEDPRTGKLTAEFLAHCDKIAKNIVRGTISAVLFAAFVFVSLGLRAVLSRLNKPGGTRSGGSQPPADSTQSIQPGAPAQPAPVQPGAARPGAPVQPGPQTCPPNTEPPAPRPTTTPPTVNPNPYAPPAPVQTTPGPAAPVPSGPSATAPPVPLVPVPPIPAAPAISPTPAPLPVPVPAPAPLPTRIPAPAGGPPAAPSTPIDPSPYATPAYAPPPESTPVPEPIPPPQITPAPVTQPPPVTPPPPANTPPPVPTGAAACKRRSKSASLGGADGRSKSVAPVLLVRIRKAELRLPNVSSLTIRERSP